MKKRIFLQICSLFAFMLFFSINSYAQASVQPIDAKEVKTSKDARTNTNVYTFKIDSEPSQDFKNHFKSTKQKLSKENFQFRFTYDNNSRTVVLKVSEKHSPQVVKQKLKELGIEGVIK